MAMFTESDASIALDYIRGLIRAQDPEHITYFVHEGEPVSKARARWTRRGHTYTPERTQTAQEALAWRFRQVVKDTPWIGNVALVAVFYRPNYQRIDADNLMKLVMDAGTQAGVWKDDCQVTHQMSVVELDAERPRTIVAMCPVESSLNRRPDVEFVCVVCAKPFSLPRAEVGRRKPKYCSSDCHNKGATVRDEARCPKCETVFQRQRAGQRYCSNACKHAEASKRAIASLQRPPAVCSKCGERVSRREYLFCAKCRRKGRKPGSKNKPNVEAA